jgi:acyl carrier protein
MLISEIKQIADQHQRKLAPLTEESVLINTGLDSLCFAVLIARLEDRLGSIRSRHPMPSTFR